MPKKTGLVALVGTLTAVGAGLAAEKTMVKRRRRDDPEGGEPFGERRGARSRTVRMPDGAELFVEEAGPESRRGAVFIHGAAMRTDMWHYQLAGIGGHRLLFYDQRGHGLSLERGTAPFNIPTLADDLEIVIDDAGLEEVVLVGHSLGGMVALEFCHGRRHPLSERVKGVVLANTTHRSAYETITGGAALARLERFARHPLEVIGSQHHRLDRLRKVITPSDSIFLAVSFAAFGPHASARQIDFAYDMLAETSTDLLFDIFKCFREFDVTDFLGDVSVPALVIGGTHDRLTVSHASEYMATHLPKAELQLIQGCGHMSMLERHSEFNALIGRFIDDMLGASSETVPALEKGTIHEG